MIEEFGIVKNVFNGFAEVVVERGAMCGHCPSKNICHPFGDDNKKFEIKAKNSIHARVGDRVKIVIDNKSFLKASFVVYGIPIIFLLFFSIIGKLLFKSDIFSFITGFLGMILSYIIIKYYDRKREKNFYPEIVEITNEDSCH